MWVHDARSLGNLIFRPPDVIQFDIGVAPGGTYISRIVGLGGAAKPLETVSKGPVGLLTFAVSC
jgi:hypothetical protein